MIATAAEGDAFDREDGARRAPARSTSELDAVRVGEARTVADKRNPERAAFAEVVAEMAAVERLALPPAAARTRRRQSRSPSPRCSSRCRWWRRRTARLRPRVRRGRASRSSTGRSSSSRPPARGLREAEAEARNDAAAEARADAAAAAGPGFIKLGEGAFKLPGTDMLEYQPSPRGARHGQAGAVRHGRAPGAGDGQLRRARQGARDPHGPGRHDVRVRAGAGHAHRQDRQPGERSGDGAGGAGGAHRRADPRQGGGRHRGAEQDARDGLPEGDPRGRVLHRRQQQAAGRPRQGHQGRAGQREPGQDAAPAGRRHHRLGQVGRGERHDHQPALQRLARGRPLHHGRPEDARALDLRGHPAPAAAGGHRSEEGEPGAALGGRGDGAPLRAARQDRRARHQQLQREDRAEREEDLRRHHGRRRGAREEDQGRARRPRRHRAGGRARLPSRADAEPRGDRAGGDAQRRGSVGEGGRGAGRARVADRRRASCRTSSSSSTSSPTS